MTLADDKHTENETSVLDPDASLIIAMAAGESSALNSLMERHLSTIKSLAWHMLGDDMAAEDVTQEVFLKSWIAARDWTPGKAKFITWMRRVATNKCLDRLRKKKEVLGDTLPEMTDKSPSALKKLENQETADIVNSALQTLPDRQRAALTLSHYQDMSQNEAAQILEISVSAYESLLARARRALKGILMPQKAELLQAIAPIHEGERL